MPDPEHPNGIFDGGAGAVIVGIRLIGRHEARHVAHDEELARRRPEHPLRIEPGIRAGDDQRLRLLPAMRHGLVPSPFGWPYGLAKLQITLDQSFHDGSALEWRFFISRLAVDQQPLDGKLAIGPGRRNDPDALDRNIVEPLRFFLRQIIFLDSINQADASGDTAPTVPRATTSPVIATGMLR